MKTIYICEGCDRQYNSHVEALKCEESTEIERVVSVGDIVLAKSGFGWYDGDIRWVSNPKVRKLATNHKPEINCSDNCCCFSFYYVVILIDIENHRVRYHLATNAMKKESGYHSGWTFNEHHYKPKKVKNPPEFIVKDSKNLVGEKAHYLL